MRAQRRMSSGNDHETVEIRRATAPSRSRLGKQLTVQTVDSEPRPEGVVSQFVEHLSQRSPSVSGISADYALTHGIEDQFRYTMQI